MQRMSRVLGSGMVLFGALTLATPVHADIDPDKAIEYRQQLFRTLTANLTGIVLNVRGDVDFAENVPTHANTIAATLPMIKGALEIDTAGQGSARTRAKPEIWSDWSTFERLYGDAVTQAERLAEVASSDDLGAVAPEVQAMASACSACHDRFRD